MRTCPKCKEEKPDTAFYSYKYQCKACHQSYQKDPEKRRKTSQKYYNKRKKDNPALFMWKQAKHRAEWDYGGMEFTIEVEDILIPEVCPYMGVPFVPLDPKYGHSLDRIYSSKGYVKGNIQVITRIANLMKSGSTEQELITFAKGVLAVHQGGPGPC